MKVFALSLRISLAMVVMFSAASEKGRGTTRTLAGSPVGTAALVEADLRLIASLPRRGVTGGEPIILKLSLTNTTSKDVIVVESNPLADYKIDVRDQRGRPVPPTPEGKDLLFHSLWVGRRLSVRLAPGDKKVETFEINKVYDMSKPGSYTVTGSRRALTDVDKSWVELKSNIVKVTVLP